MKSDEVIDLYLPDKAFAEQTFAFLKKQSLEGPSPVNTHGATGNLPDPATLCKSTVTFMNDLLTSNFKNYLGDFISSGMGFSFYTSKIPFPDAIETIISDTSALRPDYRRAEILMKTETISGEELSEPMRELYAHLCSVLKKCLEGNGFSNEDFDPYKTYKLQTRFTRYLQNNSNSPFANLQTRRGLIVHVRVRQSQPSPGNYANKLYLDFEQQ